MVGVGELKGKVRRKFAVARRCRLTLTGGACAGLCAGDIDVPTHGGCVGVDGYGAGCSNMRESAKSAIFSNSPQWGTTGRMR